MNTLIFGLASAFCLMPVCSIAASDSKPERSLVSLSTFDSALRRGDSDRLGDSKRFEAYYRSGPWVLGASGELLTPQSIKASSQFDTAIAKITAGYETGEWGLYGSLGVVNGSILSNAHTLLRKAHTIIGIPSARTSPASSPLRPAIEITVRHDTVFSASRHEKFGFGGAVTPYVRIGDVEIKAGLAVIGVMSFGDATVYRQDIPGLPTVAPHGNFLRFGLIAETLAYSVLTDRQGTKWINAAAVAGFGFQRGSWSMSADLLVPISPRVTGMAENPISEISFRLGRRL
jgi:hypothetical protein